MARGIPIPFNQLPQTQTNLGGFQKSAGIEGLNTDASTSIRAAGNTVQADPRGFIVQAGAVGAIGQAIAGEGQAMMALQLKQNEAVNIRKEHEAMLSMELAQEAISADIANEPDEMKWAGIAEKRISKLKESVFTGDLSPDARDAITMRFGDWQKRQGQAVTISSARKSFEKAGDSILGEATRAVNRKDPAMAQELLIKAKEAGYITDAQLAQEEGRLQKLWENNKARDAYGFAIENPDEFLKDPKKYVGDLDPKERDNITNQARQAKGQAESMEVDNLSDRLAEGEFKTLADLQGALPEGMRPTVKKQFEGMFLRGQEPGIKAKMEADAPQNFARFSDAVDGYDAKGDPDGIRYAQIVMAVKQAMPVELRGEILGPLYRKRPGASSDIEPPEPLKTTVKDIIGNMFDSGAFGDFKRLEIQKDANGRERLDLMPKEVEDAKAKAAAYVKKGTAMIYMSKWMAANPEASTEKAYEAVRGVLSGSAPPIRSLVPRAAPPTYEQKPGKPALVAPWENDLPPEQPGAIDPLIPFYLPVDQQLPE